MGGDEKPDKGSQCPSGNSAFELWRTELAYAWVINCEPGIQDDMHYHENDDHIFMVLEGECPVRTPHKEFVLKRTTR
jgi:hypothetical protein